MLQIDWITDKSLDKYAKKAVHEELNAFYGVAKFMRDSGMEHGVIAENLKTMYGATPEQVEMIQKEVLGKTADVGLTENNKYPQEEVNYKNYVSCCGTCNYFIAQRRDPLLYEHGACKIVEGLVYGVGICDRFEGR